MIKLLLRLQQCICLNFHQIPNLRNQLCSARSVAVAIPQKTNYGEIFDNPSTNRLKYDEDFRWNSVSRIRTIK